METIITGTCGHTYEKNLLTFNGSEPATQGAATRLVNKGIRYWSTRTCPDCYGIAKKAEKAEVLAEFGRNLPALVGSDKQIAWATRIREDQVPKTSGLVNELATIFDALSVDWLNKRIDVVFSTTEAKFWIDTRDWPAASLLGLDYSDTQDQKVEVNITAKEVIYKHKPVAQYRYNGRTYANKSKKYRGRVVS